MAILEADEILQNLQCTLIDVATFDIQIVLNELFGVLTKVYRSAPRESQQSDKVASQRYLLRLISLCAAAGLRSGAIIEDVLASKAVSICMSILTTLSPSNDSASDGPQRSDNRASQLPRLLERSISRSTVFRDFEAEVEEEACIRTLTALLSDTNPIPTLKRICEFLKQPYLEDDEACYNKKLGLLAFLTLDLSSIEILLSAIAGVFGSLLRSSQLIVAATLQISIGHWLEQRPEELWSFSSPSRRQLSLTGVKLFNPLYDHAESSRRKAIVWPLLAYLILLYSDADLSSLSKSDTPKFSQYLQGLAKASHTKMGGLAFESYEILLYAASRTPLSQKSVLVDMLPGILSVLPHFQQFVREFILSGTVKSPRRLVCSCFRLRDIDDSNYATDLLLSWLGDESSPIKFEALLCIKDILAEHLNGPRQEHLKIMLRRTRPLIIKIFSIITPSDLLLQPNAMSEKLQASRALIEVLHWSPDAFLSSVFDENHQDELRTVETAILTCLASDDIDVTKGFSKLVIDMHNPAVFEGNLLSISADRQYPRDKFAQAVWPDWIHLSSSVICATMEQINGIFSTDVPRMKSLLDLLIRMMQGRIATLARNSNLLGTANDLTEHTRICNALEITLLTLSTHVDTSVVTSAISACNLLTQEDGLYARIGLSRQSASAVGLLYSDNTQEKYPILGRNALQRKVRTSLRVARDSPNLRKAWKLVYDRWSKLTDSLFDDKQQSMHNQQDQEQVEWLNYTGFLAASARLEDTEDDRPVLTFIERFQEVFIQSHTEFISEACAEILGAEVHLSLYISVLHKIHLLIGAMKDSKGVLIVRTRNTILVEQIILICRGLFDRLDTFLPLKDGINVGEVLLELAHYLDLCSGLNLRSQLRFCHLCEAFAVKLEFLAVLRESSTRRRLCNYLASWIIRPRANGQDLEKLARDTNTACLKALIQLTRDLRLAPEPSSTGMQIAGDLGTYVKFVLPWLALPSDEHTTFNSGTLRPLFLQMTVHILAANRRLALGTFISLCYHEDFNVCAAFTSVIATRLQEGGVAAFKSLSSIELYLAVWKIISSDSNLLTAILDGSPASASPIEPLLDFFELRDASTHFFSMVVETESALCDQESELWRRNSAATRLFAALMRRYGGQYLRETLQGPLEILAHRNDDYSMDLDSSRMTNIDPQTLAVVLAKNKRNIEETCQQFIDAICGSVARVPV